MSDISSNRHFILVKGIDTLDSDPSTIRRSLRSEFSQIGNLTKLYLNEAERFAKCYFDTIETCQLAIKQLGRNNFGWILSHECEPPFGSNFKIERNSDNNNSTFRKNHKDNTTMDSYLEEEFTENIDYCNVHGQPLVVFQADTGDLFINLKDIRKTGFALFRRDTYDSILIDREQINREFELHLLTEAKNYLLKHRINHIDEDKILETIARCKNKLLSSAPQSAQRAKPTVRTVANNNDRDTSFDTFGPSSSSSFVSAPTNPQTLPHNFFPSSRHFNNIPHDNSRDRTGGFKSDTFRNENRNNDFKAPASNKYHNRNRNEESNRYDSNSFPDSKAPDTNNYNHRNKRDVFNKPDSFSNKSGFNKDFEKDSEGFTKPESKSFSTKRPFNKGFEDDSQGFNKPEPENNSFTKRNFNKGFDNDSQVFNKAESNSFSNKRNFKRGTDNDSHSSENSLSTRKIHHPALPRDSMEIGKTYNVKVTYCEPDRDNICWVQRVESADHADQILLDVSEVEAGAEIVSSPSKGQLVLAEFEGVWYRAEVLNPTTNLVHFIDYGNRSNVESMKAMPDTVKTNSSFANRLVLNKLSAPIKEGDDLSVTVNKQYDDGTLICDCANQSSAGVAKEQQKEEKVEVTSSPQEDLEIEKKAEPPRSTVSEPKLPKTYFSVPAAPLLKDGDKVMLLERIGSKLAVKSKECVDRSKELMAYIKELDKTSLILPNVKEGQLVLCSKENHVGLCRAIVTQVMPNNAINVTYVDYPGEDVLTVKSLRNVDEYLATQPACLIITPEIPYLESLTVAALNFVTELISMKEKVVVVMAKEGLDFRLQTEKLLSATLSEKFPSAAEPAKNEQIKQAEPSTSISKSDEKVTFYDMDWIELSPGEYNFLCYHVKDVENITLISTVEKHINYMQDVSDIEDPDKKPYAPEVEEMCLVFYTNPGDTDGFWYRGVVLAVEKSEYVVLMVDFGNDTTVTSDQIRKFPQKFKKIPILGITCTLKGLPSTDEINEKLKALIVDNQDLKVIVKRFDDVTLKYVIEIPEVEAELRK